MKRSIAANLKTTRQKSFGLWALRNKAKAEPNDKEDFDVDLYHSRRKNTKYRVGFEDLEEPVVNLIKETRKEMYLMHDKIKELQKEVLDYKKYLEMQTTNRDLSFYNEVRECLTQQLSYVNEIQNEMLKEVDGQRNQFNEVGWQIAKLETNLEDFRIKTEKQNVKGKRSSPD